MKKYNDKIILKNYFPICFNSNHNLIVSKKNNIYNYCLLTNKLEYILSLPSNYLDRILESNKYTYRVFRKGVRYGVNMSANKILLVYQKLFYEIDVSEKSAKQVFDLERGNRPLNIAKIDSIKGFNNSFCFGEYFSNFKKEEVHIYSRGENENWFVSYTFPRNTIEHVHAIIPDKFRNCVWIFTGDLENSAAIWKATDDFKVVTPVLKGSQEYRACVGFPIKEGLIYATDSQFSSNSIRIMILDENNNWVSKHLQDVNGPVIYGCQYKENFIFSTSVEGESEKKGRFLKYFDSEPGLGIQENYSHLVVGQYENGFRLIEKYKKDAFPFILFQFGAIIFPSGINNSDYLVSSNIALSHFNQSIILQKI